MPNGEHGQAPNHVTQRDLWLAIEQLRNETRAARHALANSTTKGIAELRTDVDLRLRSIEKVIDSSNPVSLGPRLNELERWQSRLDADEVGGAPKRLSEIEAVIDQMRGTVAALRIVAAAATIVAAIAGAVALVKP